MPKVLLSIPILLVMALAAEEPFTLPGIPVPTTFFVLFSTIMVGVFSLLAWLLKNTRQDQDRATVALTSAARSLALVEERLAIDNRRSEAMVPLFVTIQSDIGFIKSAIVSSTIVPPGTKASVEPGNSLGKGPIPVEIVQPLPIPMTMAERQAAVDAMAKKREETKP